MVQQETSVNTPWTARILQCTFALPADALCNWLSAEIPSRGNAAIITQLAETYPEAVRSQCNGCGSIGLLIAVFNFDVWRDGSSAAIEAARDAELFIVSFIGKQLVDELMNAYALQMCPRRSSPSYKATGWLLSSAASQVTQVRCDPYIRM
jgi:hypothetical protein